MPTPSASSTPPSKPRRRRGYRLRAWRLEDIPGIVAVHAAAYPDYQTSDLYDQRQHALQLEAFPEGQLLVEHDGEIVGYATSLIVQLDEEASVYRFSELTGMGTFSTHDPSGDTLYGADIAVHPDHRGKGVAGRLYQGRIRLLKRYNLRRMVAFGRIPGFKDHEGKLTADEYVQLVVAGKLKDSALNAHLKAGYTVKKVLLDYMEDVSSLNYSTLLEMENPDFKPDKRRISSSPIRRPLRRMRVCAAQWLMRRISTWEEFEQIVLFFVDSADSYHCHFLLLPELFTAQLFSTFPSHLPDIEAMQRLADLTPRYVDLLSRHASERGLYIVGGSQPVRRDGKTYNVAHLFTPSGKVYTQDKLHVTPHERALWDIEPGEEIRLFETPFGRMAIQICYDIEFPETARLLTLAGAEVIFVPFSTDEKKAYYRVRYAAQSRAVENYVYTVLAGNVGNLPSVRSYLINYGQSAVLTPSDFGFPIEGVMAEAEPNVETVVVAELDMNVLEEQRDYGSVRPLYDRRPDLYNIEAKKPVRVIKCE